MFFKASLSRGQVLQNKKGIFKNLKFEYRNLKKIRMFKNQIL